MHLKTKEPVTFICQCAFLFLAFAVFSLGLKARLASYENSPNITIVSAKVSTETRSAKVLKSLEVQRDTTKPAVQVVLAILLAGLSDETSPSNNLQQVSMQLFGSTRPQLACITSLRRPPPLFI